MFRNMKVGARLALGFSITIAFMIAIIAVSLYQAQVSHENLNRIVKINNVRVSLANEMIDDARETAISVRNIMLAAYNINNANSSESLRKEKDYIVEFRSSYLKSIDAIKKLIPEDDKEGIALVGALEVSAATAWSWQDRAIELAVAGKPVEGYALVTEKAYPAVKQWISETNKLIHYSAERTILRYNEAEKAENFARTTMIILGSVAIALSLMIVIILSLSITRPLSLTANAATRISSGDLKVDLSAAEKRGDELGIMAQAFSKMVAVLRAASFYTRNLIEASLDPLVTISADGKITDVNSATEQVTGVSRERLIGSDFADYFTEPEKARSGYKQVFSQGSVKDYPLAIRHVSGKITDVLYNASVYKNEAGEVQGIFAAARDVTESRRMERDMQRQDWLKTGIAKLNQAMSGDTDITSLASKVISEISTYLDAQIGAIYLAGNDDVTTFSLMGSYAYKKRKDLSNVFKIGEGLVGQAAFEKQQILLRNVPEDYIKISSGLGERIPKFICVTPFIREERVKGVVEVGMLNEMTDLQMEYLQQAMAVLAIAVESAQNRTNLARSLEESQSLSEELQTQQEELKTSNEELEEQTKALKSSEEKLKAQQEELQVTNEELEEKNDLLDRQKKDVERARKDIEKKADELAIASKYKSEFLANMSHELRTPLNSLLLLSQSLSENKEKNLSSDQVESARIIYGSGSDLLNLINEILDLSKIEAGKMDLHVGEVRISDLADSLRSSFGHMADNKKLKLDVLVREDAPPEIMSDRKRIEQVTKNLMANAIKFTDSGGVTVTFTRPLPDTNLSGEYLAIEVKDTGIGIAPESQKIIFEAFQQVDGGTARKYGGTGLGLSISRELVRILQGEIRLKSELGKGSTFTLYLPLKLSSVRKPELDKTVKADYKGGAEVKPSASRKDIAALHIEDDRDNLKQDDKFILVIEDDPNFARLLYKKCHEKEFKCLAAPTGEEGLELAGKHLPSAVILDLSLPGMDGWAVMDALKENTNTRHVPVHIISAEEASTESVRKGAAGHVTKPLRQEDLEETFRKFEKLSAGKPKRLLIVDDDMETRRKTVKLIADADVKVDEADTGKKAMEALRTGQYDCVVLDLKLPDMDGMSMLGKLEQEGVKIPPVIVYTCRDLTRYEEMEIREQAEAIVIKDVRSQERLLDEISLFLHLMVSKMPEKQRKMIRSLHSTDEIFKGKKVLIVDDDMRTTFAMSRLLSECGMNTLKAENGDRALRLLDENPDVDLVLMDIMMPMMDGYEAMKRIRSLYRFKNLPIIALTAKAMPEDREKCLAAGANDYLPKPVDQKRLVSLMRVWLCR